MGRSLQAAGHPLAVVEEQRLVLRPEGKFPPFDARLAESTQPPLRADRLDTLQINVGRLCNQTCGHCHVDAGPDRTEIMPRSVMEQCLDLLDRTDITTVDLTGGAPEMNPDFRWFVERIRERGRHIIDRCNLTILTVPSYAWAAPFLAEHQVEIVSSLPYYTAGNTDRQRGQGVFDRSIDALRKLNALGYGQPDSPLMLSLVYNPLGAFLPPDQAELEATFKTKLWEQFGIVFHRLYAITNQPINRFLEYLLRSGNYEGYMQQLIDAYNPASVAGVMCRSLISVSWDGYVYDCDFNQMLDLPTAGPERSANARPLHVRDLDPEWLRQRPIVTGLHCYACTAGQGSSCGGRTA